MRKYQHFNHKNQDLYLPNNAIHTIITNTQNSNNIYLNKRYIIFHYLGNRFKSIPYTKTIKSLNHLLPPPLHHTKIQITFKYSAPISSKFFNYNTCLNNLQSITEVKNIINKTCKCNSIQSKEPTINNHIMTTNAQKLYPQFNQLFALGTKFRLEQPTQLNTLIHTTNKDINEFTTYLTNKYPQYSNNIHNWKLKLSDKLQKLITDVYNKPYQYNSILYNLYTKFIKLQQTEPIPNWIITTVDKASNNYGFTCSNLYLQLLSAELGIDTSKSPISITGNITYKPLPNLNLQQLFLKHKRLTLLFKADIKLFKPYIPLLYGIPKIHKNPPKLRFIAGASKSSIKPLHQLLHYILSNIRTLFKTLTNTDNKYYSISNTLELLQNINEYTNDKQYYTTITTADFSTLYTNLDHNIILDNLQFIYKFILNKNHHNYFIYNTYTHKLITTNHLHNTHNTILLQYNELMTLTNHVIKENYVRFTNIIFQQIRGIPMGGNASPYLADLTLSAFEYKYSQLPKHIQYYRYLDDILILNETRPKQLLFNIYQRKLEFTTAYPTSESPTLPYLDLNLSISQFHQINYKLYNKKHHFPFTVIQNTTPLNNVHPILNRAILLTELLRLLRINQHFQDFINNTKLYLKQYTTFPRNWIIKIIQKFVNKNFHYICNKYNLISTYQYSRYPKQQAIIMCIINN